MDRLRKRGTYVSQSQHKKMLGLKIGVASLDTLLRSAMTTVRERSSTFKFACANPHSLVAASKDAEFMDALRSCDAVVADGIGVTLVGRLTGVDVGPRITGLAFFQGIMHSLNHRGGRVFFFGSTDAVLQKVIVRARHEFPNIHIEVFSPPYGAWSEAANQQMIARIRDARPDVLWVGMTAPKQEKWMHRNASVLEVPVMGAIGAVFQYYAGEIKRAPDWLCKLGFEWLYRLAGEPRRLWRRTVVSAPAFLYLVMRERLVMLLHGEQSQPGS
jgi:N-acetylglucosaminyldiphosphoundecaprenol N-acetyl-beta-D-mannosaminyltransferase